MKERKYVQFFREWWEFLREIEDDAIRVKIYDMAMAFSFDGIAPTKEELQSMDKLQKAFWLGLFPSLKNSRQHYLNGSKSPGAPKGSRNAAKFIIPTLDEVRAYFGVRGWNVCKRHFKTWQAAADRWEEKGNEFDT